jgi:uncharacterized repeat protein (TIGR03803 family)
MKPSTAALATIFATTAIGWFSAADAASETVLYSLPANAYAFDRVLEVKNHLFATTYSGGQDGTVIELTDQNRIWRATTLWQFHGADGQSPIGGVTNDNNNVLYGTTVFGGAYGAGTIYALPPQGQLTVLYNFTGGADGYEPEATLLWDKATGIFYGTTALGGSGGCGTVFQLAPSGGSWVEKTLYRFAGGADGCSPERSLHFGRRSGVLYGSTQRGGNANRGTVFALTERTGTWKEDVIYSFNGGSDGSQPADIAVDTDGTIFGLAEAGGALKHGTIFQLSQVNHIWHESVIYNFRGGADGQRPIGLHLNQIDGILYGTTEKGGSFGQGTVFSLTPSGASWVETILHSFGAAGDGAQPGARVTQDNGKGVLYGTTTYGGQFDSGTIYQITL